MLTGVAADLNGDFSLTVNSGKYYAVIQAVSFKPTTISLRDFLSNTNLGTIRLTADVKTLQEVVVSGEKPLMQMDLDKRVFNVSQDLSNVGRNAVEILDNLPSITVDQDGGVALRGSQNVRILIDGKPSGLAGLSNTDALQALQGNMIERIEVVTNPSVRYEAEGSAGIINIILKKERKDGVNAVFEGTVAHPLNTGVSANINLRKKKFNYFLNLSTNYRERPGEASSFQRFTGITDNDEDTVWYSRQSREFLRTGWSHNFRAGTDYQINQNNLLTAAFLVNVGDNSNLTDILYRDYNSLDELRRVSTRADREQEDERNLEYTLSYEKLFNKEGRKLTFYSQYRDNVETERSSITNTLITNLEPTDADLEAPQRSNNEESEKNSLLQIDYIHPFNGGKGKFETGYRGTLRKIETDYIVEEQNEQGDWNNLPEFTNTFQYDENIQAVYALVGNHVGKISFELGVRMEYTDIRTELLVGEIVSGEEPVNNKSYVNFFPSAHTNYHINDNNSVQLSYSRRVSRPGFWSLNPFSSFSDARNIRLGNPDIDPEFTDSYEVGYLANSETSSFYGGFYYRYTTDVTERVQTVISDTTFSRPVNLSNEKSYGFEVNGSKDFTKWWSVNINANFLRSITDGTYEDVRYFRDTYAWNSRLSNRFTLGKKTRMQATLFYRAPQRTTQGRTESFYTVDLGFTKDIWKNKATFSLNVRDVFNSRIFRFVNEGDDFFIQNRFQRAFTQITCSLVFRINQNLSSEKDENNQGDRNGFNQDFDN